VDKHLFALYLENLSNLIYNLKKNQTFELADKSLHNRLTRVLRLKENEQFVLFDKNLNTKLSLNSQTFENTKKIYITIKEINKNKALEPEVIFCPSLLKKNAFEEIIYTAAQMGANVIQPVITEKVQRKWGGEKERERLQKIMICACEQSKNFVMPVLHDPIELEVFLKKSDSKNSKKILFDDSGKPILDLLKNLNKQQKLFLMFGPEGGFSEKEIELIKVAGFVAYALTPTILRSVDAVILGLGCVASVVR